MATLLAVFRNINQYNYRKQTLQGNSKGRKRYVASEYNDSLLELIRSLKLLDSLVYTSIQASEQRLIFFVRIVLWIGGVNEEGHPRQCCKTSISVGAYIQFSK